MNLIMFQITGKITVLWEMREWFVLYRVSINFQKRGVKID
jgi:hypothetical protein